MKAAVLVIDVQSILFDPQPQPFEADVVVQRINQVTGWARQCGYPVVFIQHERADTVIAFGSDGWQLQSSLITAPSDQYVRKTTPDSFLRTPLAAVLEADQIEHLIVCGYATEFCVDTTVRQAAGLGYSIGLVEDAHTTHDKAHSLGQQIRKHHNETLPKMSSFGVGITTVPTAELIAG